MRPSANKSTRISNLPRLFTVLRTISTCSFLRLNSLLICVSVNVPTSAKLLRRLYRVFKLLKLTLRQRRDLPEDATSQELRMWCRFSQRQTIHRSSPSRSLSILRWFSLKLKFCLLLVRESETMKAKARRRNSRGIKFHPRELNFLMRILLCNLPLRPPDRVRIHLYLCQRSQKSLLRTSLPQLFVKNRSLSMTNSLSDHLSLCVCDYE